MEKSGKLIGMKGSIVKRILLKIPELILRLAYLVFAFAIIGVVAYYFANLFLRGLLGNDTLHALNLVHWVDKYFPKIPFWYHLQGGGVSMLWSYPSLPPILVVLLNRVSHLGISVSYQLVVFSSFVITALGMYFFVWLCLKSQTAALIAAVIYFIMPLSYCWMADWGFFGETVSYMFFFPSLIFYDFFLQGYRSGKMTVFRRLCLFLAVVFTGLLFNAHPMGFFTLIFVFLAESLFYTIFKQLKGKNILAIIKSLLPGLIVFGLSVGLIAFVVVNFIYYPKQGIPGEDEMAARFKNNDLKFYITNYSIVKEIFLGVGRIPFDHFQFPLRNMTVQPFVWIFALAGLVLSILFYRKVFFYIFISYFSLAAMVYPEAFFQFARFLMLLPGTWFTYFLNMRSFLNLIRFLFPIAAAFAFVGAGRLVLLPFTFWARYLKNKIITGGVYLFRDIAVVLIALPLFIYSFYYFADQPNYMWRWYIARYGYWLIDVRNPINQFPDLAGGMDVVSGTRLSEMSEMTGHETTVRMLNLYKGCHNLKLTGSSTSVCSKLYPEDNMYKYINYGYLEKDIPILADFEKVCKTYTLSSPERQLCPLVMSNKLDLYKAALYSLKDISAWPKPILKETKAMEEVFFPYPNYLDWVKKMANQKNLRVDVSPTNGGIAMGLNAVSDMSMINLYTYTASLIGPYWGYQQQVAFQKNDEKEETATEVAKWFGTKYLLINPDADYYQKYLQKGSWETELKDVQGRPSLFKLKSSPEMETWTKDKPKVLVIGDKAKRVFELVFRIANKGTLPYDDYWLLEGKERIDDYSLAELKQYEIVYLFGYKYHNQSRAWNLIDGYLKTGGKVFLSTGWQFVDQDWETKKTPAWFPVTSLAWTTQFTGQSKYRFDLSTIGSTIDTSGFGALEWNGGSYGVSIPKGLRDWAKPVLSVDGKTLVAVGDYGQGKVVWTGLNLPGHMHTFNYNEAELGFYKSLFDWLRGSTKPIDLTTSVEIIRENPDKVNFLFSKEVNDPTFFYWRESFFPAWKARLVSGKKTVSVKINYGGPRFMSMILPAIKTGDILELEFIPGSRHQILIFIALLTFLLMLIYVFIGEKIYQPILILVKKKIRKVGLVTTKQVKRITADEEEY